MKKWLQVLICTSMLLVIAGCGQGKKDEKATEKAYEIETIYGGAEEGILPYKVHRLDEETLVVYGSNDTYESGLFKVDLKHEKTTLITDLKDNHEVYFTDKGCFWLEAKGMWELRDKYKAKQDENEEQSDEDQEAYYKELDALDRNLMFMDYDQTKPETFIASTENIKVLNFNVASSNELQVDFQDKKENSYFKMAVDMETKKSEEIRDQHTFNLYRMPNRHEVLTADDGYKSLIIKNTENDKQKKLNMKYEERNYYEHVSYLDGNLLFFTIALSDKNESLTYGLELYDFDKKEAEEVVFDDIDTQEIKSIDSLQNYVILTYLIDDTEEKSSLQKFEAGEFKQVQVDELENGSYKLVSMDETDEWILFDSENQDKQWMIIKIKGAKE